MDLLTPEDLCEMIPGTSVWTWTRLYTTGRGPRVTRVGRARLYRRADVEAWLDAQREGVA
ncbi:helix-turn-helix transcriptional regulator [Corynebacterium sphenisci]|uniref:helix-turn-helix transcriptional regulator n=1 Tax=Corynebacterium sphenisci TaxID=191493 RepID=UPI0009FCE967|nr:helix-turn-helix domain-containing protein [Corynebacterium sphenisci]